MKVTGAERLNLTVRVLCGYIVSQRKVVRCKGSYGGFVIEVVRLFLYPKDTVRASGGWMVHY